MTDERFAREANGFPVPEYIPSEGFRFFDALGYRVPRRQRKRR